MRTNATSFLRRSARARPSGVAVLVPKEEQEYAEPISRVNQRSFFGAQALCPSIAMRLRITLIVLYNDGLGSTKTREASFIKGPVLVHLSVDS